MHLHIASCYNQAVGTAYGHAQQGIDHQCACRLGEDCSKERLLPATSVTVD